MKYARIVNNTVVETVDLADEFAIADIYPPEMAWIPATEPVQEGWRYINSVFAAPVQEDPAPIVPSVVTMRQARLALVDAGKYAAVQTAVEGADDRTRVEWEFAATVERASPVVALLAQAVGLDDSALDELFTAAAKL